VRLSDPHVVFVTVTFTHESTYLQVESDVQLDVTACHHSSNEFDKAAEERVAGARIGHERDFLSVHLD